MEVWKIVTLIIILIVATISAYYTVKIMVKKREERIYVYPKTGHRYMPLYRCKMKCPVDGIWHKAVIYEGLDDRELYVRKLEDFIKEFVRLKDYDNNSRK